MNSFIVIDVETANADYASICQIGIVEFENSKIVNTWKTYVNPQDIFDEFNIEIHGITPDMVIGAPTFKDLYPTLKEKLNNKITVHHMPFDRTAINQSCERYYLDYIETNWLDSARIVRRAWTQFAHTGYALAKISEYLNIEFKHHDALEDAIAAGKVVIEAINKTGLSIDEWIDRSKKPVHLYKDGSTAPKLDGNPEGDLYGENIVFTGSLSIPRHEAAQLAAQMGCNVQNGITKKTTILVVGQQDDFKLAGYEKSSKHRKAEEYIRKGIKIRIISEKDFFALTHQ